MPTVNALAVSIIQELEESTDDSGYVTRIEARINDALDEIAIATNFNMFHTRATFATVIGQAQYNMPQGAREIIQLRYTDTGEAIPLMTIQEAARRGIKLEDSGRARAWMEDGNVVSGSNVLLRIRLTPVPSAVVNIEEEHYYFPSDAASGSVIPVQDQYVSAVRNRVLAKVFQLDQKYDAADRFQRSYEQDLQRLVNHENRKVAKNSVLKQTDLQNVRRRERAIFDPSHYSNNW